MKKDKIFNKKPPKPLWFYGGGRGITPLEPEKDFTSEKFLNEQKKYSPKAGWGFYPSNIAAFTLSEVILTIGIIGIVAALTIPQLVQNSNNKELVAGFLKTHSVLSNAFKEAEAVEEIKVYKLSGLEEFKTFFEKHLKTQANCDYDVCLADGSKFDYDTTFYEGCTNQAEGSSSALKESCVKLIVDVNGKKGPNQAGKDIYNLWVTRQGVIPEGEQDTCSNLDCGAYVLAYHRLYDAANPYVYYSPIKNCDVQDGDKCTTCSGNFDGEKCNSCKDTFSGKKCDECASGYIFDISQQNCVTGYIKDGFSVYKIGDYDVANVGEVLPYRGNTPFTLAACNSQPNYPDKFCVDYYEAAKQQCEALGMTIPSVSQLTDIYRNWSNKPSGSYWTNQQNGTRFGCIAGTWNLCSPDCSWNSVYVHDLDGNVVYDENNQVITKPCGGGANLVVDFDNGYVRAGVYDPEWFDFIYDLGYFVPKVEPKVLCVK